MTINYANFTDFNYQITRSSKFRVLYNVTLQLTEEQFKEEEFKNILNELEQIKSIIIFNLMIPNYFGPINELICDHLVDFINRQT